MLFRLLLLGATVAALCDAQVTRAVAVLTVGSLRGCVHFTKIDSQVLVEGNVTGLHPGQHGFHVHRFGDLRDGCTSAGPHFNPQSLTHGAPEDDIRHVGDLGNIEADANGKACFTFYDRLLDFEGEHNIIGRAVVIHEKVDDLGRKGDEGSLATGNAGGRLGCGVIGIVKP